MEKFKVKQVIVIRKDLNMRKGKLASQVSHSSLASVLDKMTDIDRDDEYGLWQRMLSISKGQPMYDWLTGSFAKIVVYVENEQDLLDLIEEAKEQNIQVTPITDLGHTEFHGVPTLTCAAFGPEYSEKLDPLTGHLPLI